jgi:hypothetical protein
VADDGAWRHIRAEVEKDRKMAGIARVAAGEVEGERQAIKVALQMDLGGEAAARAAQRLTLLPPSERFRWNGTVTNKRTAHRQ